MIRAGVIGAAGFAGVELVRWIIGHSEFDLVAVSSETDAGKPIASLYPGLQGKCSLAFVTHTEALSYEDMDVVFLAVPHTAAFAMVPSLLARGIAVVDLSADYRLKDVHVYEQWYRVTHSAPQFLEHAVYGLPEITRALLQEKSSVWRASCNNATEQAGSVLPPLVANPGCYPTATLLAIAPLFTNALAVPGAPVVVNAISGVSGAGRKTTATTHFCSASDDLAAYGAATHRHTPEIAQVLTELAGVETPVIFTPHLAPLKRGMISTVVVPLVNNIDAATIESAYTQAYANEPFVSFLPFGTMPHSAHVASTNNVHVGVAYDVRIKSLVASCAIDNLGKGAASQAIQNANIIFGFEETAGLDGLVGLV